MGSSNLNGNYHFYGLSMLTHCLPFITACICAKPAAAPTAVPVLELHLVDLATSLSLFDLIDKPAAGTNSPAFAFLSRIFLYYNTW